MFRREKSEFSPLFSETAGPIELKFFLQVLGTNRGGCFFFRWKITFVWDLAGFRTHTPSKKDKFFGGSSVFCLSWPVETVFFNEKKNTHPDSFLVLAKKISARSVQPFRRKRGKTFGVFGSWEPQNPLKEASDNFESMTSFALLIDIYLPWEFHKFSLSHSLERPERGGGPLKVEFYRCRLLIKNALLWGKIYW